MLDIIKTIRICDVFNLSLVYFHSTKGYEVQYSNDDRILDTDGIYSTRKSGLIAFNRFKKQLIKAVE